MKPLGDVFRRVKTQIIASSETPKSVSCLELGQNHWGEVWKGLPKGAPNPMAF